MNLAEAARLFAAGDHAGAEVAYRALIAAGDAGFEAWAGLGHAAAACLEYGTAIPAMRKALSLAPHQVWLRVNLAKALFALGHVSAAIAQNEAAIRDGDAEVRRMAMANQAMMAPGDPALDNAAILAIRRRFAADQAAGVVPLVADPSRGKKLRLAYVGSFFDRPNWMKMYMGVINAHDRARFEVNLIVDGPPPCAEAGYIDRPEDRIWQVTGVSNADLAGHIAAAGIEVLVDLNGYSHMARIALPLHRAAPVQIAWNGMYGTTGLPHMNALIGDHWASPPEEDAFCTEPVRRVAGTYLPFHIFAPMPPVAPPPCLATGRITFGSLASAYKITEPTIALWAAVLRACPDAGLLLRNRALDQASNQADLLARFAAQGIGAERLTLLGGASHGDFLDTYDRIDIALDTTPYSGGTTTVEALWQGVPVLTMQGDRWAARTSLSILMAAGFAEDVAPDTAGLVALARARAENPAALAARRAGQRARIAASPAANPAPLCRQLEALYLA